MLSIIIKQFPADLTNISRCSEHLSIFILLYYVQYVNVQFILYMLMHISWIMKYCRTYINVLL